jgi:hypothetical protein
LLLRSVWVFGRWFGFAKNWLRSLHRSQIFRDL